KLTSIQIVYAIGIFHHGISVHMKKCLNDLLPRNPISIYSMSRTGKIPVPIREPYFKSQFVTGIQVRIDKYRSPFIVKILNDAICIAIVQGRKYFSYVTSGRYRKGLLVH